MILTGLKCSLLLVIETNTQNAVWKSLLMKKNTWTLPDFPMFINGLAWNFIRSLSWTGTDIDKIYVHVQNFKKKNITYVIVYL